MLFAGWDVGIVKNCDRGLENASLENIYVTPKIFGVELDNFRQLLAYFIGIWRKTSVYQIRTFQYGPRAAFSRPRSQFFTIRTDPKPVNNLFIFSYLNAFS